MFTMRRALQVLMATAAGDLIVRGVVELFGLGATEALPAAVVLGTKLALGLPLVGWMLGWLLLGMVVFQTAPLLVPVEGATWPGSLRGRVSIAAAAVTVAVAIETLLVTGQRGLSTPFQVGEALFWAPAVVGVSSYLVARTGSDPYEGPYAYSLRSIGGPMEGGRVTFGRYLLFVLLLGVLLAAVSLLFPVPELIILGSGVVSVVGVELSFGRSLNVPGGRDVAERLTRGAAVVWTGLDHLGFVVYALAMLLVAFAYVASTTLRVDIGAVATDDPAAAALLIVVLVTVLSTIVLTVERYLERLYYEVRDKPEAKKAVERLPGMLVPAGVLAMALETAGHGVAVSFFVVAETGDAVKLNAVTRLDPTVATWLLAAVGLAGSLVVLMNPSRVRQVPGSDAVVMPLSGVAFMALLYHGGYPDAVLTNPLDSVARLAGMAIAFGGYPLGYRWLLGSNDRPPYGRLLVGLSWVVVGWIVALFIGLAVLPLDTVGASVSTAVAGPILGVFGGVTLLLIFLGVTYIAVFPFTLPRRALYVLAVLAVPLSVMYLLKGG